MRHSFSSVVATPCFTTSCPPLSHRVKLPPRFIVQRPVDIAIDNNMLEMHPDDLAALNVRACALRFRTVHHAKLFSGACAMRVHTSSTALPTSHSVCSCLRVTWSRCALQGRPATSCLAPTQQVHAPAPPPSQLRGKLRRRFYANVVSQPALQPGSVGVNETIRRNLRLKFPVTLKDSKMSIALGGRKTKEELIMEKMQDRMTVTKVDIRPKLASVRLAALEDIALEGLTGDLHTLFTKPYFEGYPTARAVRVNDLLRIPGAHRVLWFRVTEIQFVPGHGPEAGNRGGQAASGEGAAALAVGDDWGLVAAAATEPVGTRCEVQVEDAPIPKSDVEKEITETGYAEVGGLSEQLVTIREQVELPIRHPKLFSTIGVKAPKGVLMHGPPGTGKTLIARAVSNEVGAFFFQTTGADFMAAGPQVEENIRQAFKRVRENSPGILFIDEIDAIGVNREETQDPVLQRAVATLLTEMDGLKGDEHVMVIAATNRPNSLDPALRRAGRFDTEILIPVPSRAARREILDIMVVNGGMKVKLYDPEKGPGHPDNDDAVNLDLLAQETHGYVGADIKSLCTNAGFSCARRQAGGLLDTEADMVDASVYASLEVLMSDFTSGMKRITPSAMRDVVVQVPDVKFEDIGGLEDVKQELKEMIEFPVKYAALFEDMGTVPPKGALLYGPPGCGKTMLAKAIANECSANFISIKGPQLLSKWFGESEGNVREIFNKARGSAPCVLFFDEIDSIAVARGSTSGGPGISDRIVNQLLAEMDGVGERKNVFVIGATNNIGSVDKAVLRPGRLDQFIYIPLPDPPAVRSILASKLRKMPVDPALDQEALAQACSDKRMSGADIQFLVQEAVQISVRRRVAAKLRGEEAAMWAITPDCFEVAFNLSARASLSESELAKYQADAEAIRRDMGVSQQVTTGAASARWAQQFSMQPSDPRMAAPCDFGTWEEDLAAARAAEEAEAEGKAEGKEASAVEGKE